jgi:dUTP pyrophosphatase
MCDVSINFICEQINRSWGLYKCDDASNLTKQNGLDAGLDIKCSEECVILPGDSKLVSTGLYLQVPTGFVGLIWSRSGLSVKHKIEVGAGCIDSTYRGEIKVHLYNFGKTEFKIQKGDRIAQLLTIPVLLNIYLFTDELEPTDRAEKGFGSSGK